MQPLSEVPELFWSVLYSVALGALGTLGYMFGGFIKKIATANPRDFKQPAKLDGDFQPTDTAANSGKLAAEQPAEGAMLPPVLANCDVATKQAQALLTPRVERLLAKKAARKARKAQRANETVKEETEVVSANALVLGEAPTNVASESVADAGVTTPSTGDDSIMERASTVESNSAEEEPLPRAVHKEESASESMRIENDVAFERVADAGEATPSTGDDSIMERTTTAESNFAAEEPFPRAVYKEDSDSEGIRTDKPIRRMLGFRLQQQTCRWADDESEEESKLGKEDCRQFFDDSDDEDHRLLGEVPITLGNEGSDRPELEKQIPANGSFLAPCSTSKGGFCRSNERKGCRKKAMKWQVKDGWMTPFSELLKGDASGKSLPRLQPALFGPADTELAQAEPVLQADGQPLLPPMRPMPCSTAQSIQPALPTVNSTGPAVCIWKATTPPAAMTGIDGNQQELFTDGSQVFQQVPSTDGQQLFTDGKQLYASAYVMFGTPAPSQATRPPSPDPSPSQARRPPSPDLSPEFDKQLAVLMPWRKR